MVISYKAVKPLPKQVSDYLRYPLSGAWLMDNGFRVLEKKAKTDYMYAIDVIATNTAVHTLYLSEYKERYGSYPMYRYSVFRIVNEANQPVRVIWHNEIIRDIRDVRALISRFKGK